MVSGALGLFGFVQFVRYRMKEDEEKEIFYRNLHFIALFVLFAIGIALMFFLGDSNNIDDR